MKQISIWLSILVVGTFLAVGCGGGKKDEAQESAGSGEATTTVDAATAATITGKVAFDGAAPAKGEPIKMNADPNCVKMHTEAVYDMPVEVNANKTLKNVFVYVKSGLSGKFPAPSTPVEIDQKGCMYSPHVFGIQVGQKLVIKNDDPTLHNIHARPVVNAQFNAAQPVQGMTTEKSFDKPEVMVPFRCDVHNWMNAYCGVVDNPYFAVTGDDGTFSIKGLPPGTYTIETWQEKYGVQDQTVTVAAKETKDITVSYKGQ